MAPDIINNCELVFEEAHNCKEFLLEESGLTLVNSPNPEF
jgi:hypothetical protein